MVCSFFAAPAFAVTKTAINSNKWETASTWSGGSVPACGDTIVIPAGKNVEITSLLDFSLCSQVTIMTINGTLSFQTGKKLKLSCGSSITLNSGGYIVAGGGGGNSNLIDICSVTVWNTAQGTVTGPLVFEITPLPVELAYLEAVPGENGILISWVTLSETNNAFFTIEKGKDGKTFTAIGKVNGFGNSTQSHSYIFIDYESTGGVTYYRIKQTDYDGHTSYSKIIVVRLDETIEMRIYPNPTFGDLFLNIDDQYRKQSCKLLIHTMDGKSVLMKNLVINNTGYGIKLLQNEDFLKPGKYVVTLEFISKKLTQQIIVK